MATAKAAVTPPEASLPKSLVTFQDCVDVFHKHGYYLSIRQNFNIMGAFVSWSVSVKNKSSKHFALSANLQADPACCGNTFITQMMNYITGSFLYGSRELPSDTAKKDLLTAWWSVLKFLPSPIASSHITGFMSDSQAAGMLSYAKQGGWKEYHKFIGIHGSEVHLFGLNTVKNPTATPMPMWTTPELTSLEWVSYNVGNLEKRELSSISPHTR
jgi:hypothetical protein